MVLCGPLCVYVALCGFLRTLNGSLRLSVALGASLWLSLSLGLFVPSCKALSVALSVAFAGSRQLCVTVDCPLWLSAPRQAP